MSKLSDYVDLVVFDMAGTTVRDLHEVEKCFIKAAGATNLPVEPDRVLAMQGIPKKIVVKTLWSEILGDDHPDLEANVEETYKHFMAVLEHHYATENVVEVAGAEACFQWLRNQGIKVALTTGFYRKVTNIILHRLGWNKGLDEHHLAMEPSAVIDLSLTPDETMKGRPHPDMIFKAMKMLGVEDSARVVNIGDTPSDLISADAALVGLSIGVFEGTHDIQALEPHPHDVLLPNVSNLPEFLVDHFHLPVN